ncbi:MAG: pyruvate, phosphate dikinase, partial [Deltaproteobacteria bacterium]|nr:pyruvate, phosphate dikinase [Deltaproteobacteria bacterium]
MSFQLFVRSYYQPKKLAQLLLNIVNEKESGFTSLNRFLKKYFLKSYSYWLEQENPIDWMINEADFSSDKTEINNLLKEISHQKIALWKSEIENLSEDNIDAIDSAYNLLAFPGYGHFIETYRKTPNALYEISIDKRQGNQNKLFFLFLIMNTPGLLMIHEESLRDINRTLTWLIAHGDHTQDQNLIEKTFSIINEQIANYPVTILNCVLSMGEGVYQTDNSELINFFIDRLISQGFQSPMISGVGNDWKIKVNNAHIQNIRTWLKIVGNKPQWSSSLISAMTIYLSVCGVFIRDTDLFPRDLTFFLNSDIGPVYNLTKQLLRLLPAFFNDIGAEGKLRDTSTRMDEIFHRKDKLVHFLRKQSHVESSNRIIDFFEATLLFWDSKDTKHLEPFVPPDILNQVDTSGIYVSGIHRIISYLFSKDINQPKDILSIPKTQISNRINEIRGLSEQDRERANLAISFYKLLNSKYNFDYAEFESYISQLNVEAFPELEKLKDAISEKDLRNKTRKLLDYMDRLKSLILSEDSFEIREDIYKKRHFTVDIPSMYGTYHELKFDAMGLSLRVESLVNVLFEELINQIDLNLLTKATFIEIFDLLLLFDKALKLDGISSVEMERQLDLLAHSLEIREFSFTQYVDLFKGFTHTVSNIINDHFHNIHEPNLSRIFSTISLGQILPKYLPDATDDKERLISRISEIFFRDRIATSLGIQQLDLFISRILTKLFSQSEKLSDEQLNHLLNYDHKRAISLLNPKKSKLYGIIDLGNKGLNLIKLQSYGYPIPHGFIITTEVFRNRAIINNYPPAEENFRQQLSKKLTQLEKITGKTYGNPSNPLLLSVRSGSSVSQPGMMDSFLNVGNNEEIVAGITAKTNNSWFAWDNYRRFLQGYGMSFGLNRDDFDTIINEFKQKFGIAFKRKFSGEQMRQVALAYKKLILDFGIDIINSPFEQLYLAIHKVLDSWESSRAKAYRKIIGISDNWGTAVTIQSMVFGNVSSQSGSGVFFTHSPRLPGDTIKLWGDFTIGNQGEDVVSGLVKTLPISNIQKKYEIRDTDTSLETTFPAIYKNLNNIATELIYMKRWSPQEIEFTFESPDDEDLYLLQSRDMAIRDRKKTKSFDINDLLKTEDYLAHGIGVSGGAISGRIVFSLDDIDSWRKKEPDTILILIRNDTVPDDIREISA